MFVHAFSHEIIPIENYTAIIRYKKNKLTHLFALRICLHSVDAKVILVPTLKTIILRATMLSIFLLLFNLQSQSMV